MLDAELPSYPRAVRSTPPGPRSEPPPLAEDVPISHREIGLAAGVWVFFALLNVVAGHGALALALHAVAALATLGAAALAYGGRPVAAFHLATSIWVVTVTIFSVITGQLTDGALTLVCVPVLATYVASSLAGLAWLTAIGVSFVLAAK